MVAVNPVSLSLELLVGTTAGVVLKMSPRGVVSRFMHAPDDSAVCGMTIHPTLPLLFSAHVNGYIRAFDINSGAYAGGQLCT